MSESEKEESHHEIVDEDDFQARKRAEDHKRLAGYKPLKTICTLMVGPIILQVTGALYGIISTVWISKAIGKDGVSAISTYTTFDLIGKAFGYFISVSASTKISQLFGQNKGEEAEQVICDLIRISVICGAIVPAILLPIVNICARWFGANEDIVKMGWAYITPIVGCSVFTCFNVGSAGFLQGEGRTMLVGIISICSLGGSMCVLCPLFLLGIKTGIAGAGWSTAISDIVPGILVISCYFAGKFTVKPKLHQLLKPFSKHTLPSIKVGVSQLVANLAVSIPGIAIRKLIGASVDPIDYNSAIAGYNIIYRYSMITTCVVLAVSMGYIPCAAYANAAKLYRRWWRLTLHATWITFAWCVFTNIFSFAVPRYISMVFGSDPDYLRWAAPMLFTGNALGFIMWMRIIAQSILQSLQMGGRAMIITIISQLIAIVGFAFLMFYTNQHDAVRLMWSYPLSYALGFVMAIFMLWNPVRTLYILAKEQKAKQVAERKDDPDQEEEDPIELPDIDSEKEIPKSPVNDIESDSHCESEIRRISEI